MPRGALTLRTWWMSTREMRGVPGSEPAKGSGSFAQAQDRRREDPYRGAAGEGLPRPAERRAERRLPESSRGYSAPRATGSSWASSASEAIPARPPAVQADCRTTRSAEADALMLLHDSRREARVTRRALRRARRAGPSLWTRPDQGGRPDARARAPDAAPGNTSLRRRSPRSTWRHPKGRRLAPIAELYAALAS